MSALFGIVTMALGGIGAGAEGAANAAELSDVQTAVDVYMADQSLPTISPRAEAASIALGDAAWSDEFLRGLPTKCEYAWDQFGQVAQAGCGDVSCSVPAASAVVVLRLLHRKRKRKRDSELQESNAEQEETS